MLSLQYIRQRPKIDTSRTVDSRIVFNRLLLLAGRLESVEKAFEFELTKEPMALFSSGLMRKSEKTSLRSFFMPNDLSLHTNTLAPVSATFIDGGALLQKVR